MRFGLIGSGSMAAAMARGWGDPVLCTDHGSGRAQALVDELGGTRFASNRELAEAVDVVVLCHKPHALLAVAEEIGPSARAVVSVLGGIGPTALQRAYPGVPVYALMPNTPVQVRAGVIVHAVPERPQHTNTELETAILGHFARLGRIVTVPERLFDAATSVSGVGPAYLALVAEAQVDAAVRHGITAEIAAELVLGTMAGTAALLTDSGADTLATRRAVTSPGGSTARGLAALEAAGLRTAFQNAADAVTGPRGS
jgi:pyrroline-5-carboxylate reductase